jgi:membrane protease YdiL (CAAX protease family)
VGRAGPGRSAQLGVPRLDRVALGRPLDRVEGMVRPHITLTMSVAHRLYIVFVLEIVYFVGRRVSLHLFPWSSFEAEAIDSAMRLITASVYWYLFRSLIASGTVNQSALRSPLLAVGLLSFMCIPVLVGHYALSPPVAWMFAATSFFVAIKEEFLFRGIVQNLLTQRLGPSKAILSTSVAFTLSHVGVPEFTLWVFSQIFVASVILGTVYIYGGSIFVVVAIHAVYDAIFSFTPLIAQPLPQNLGFLPLLAALLVVLCWARSSKRASFGLAQG